MYVVSSYFSAISIHLICLRDFLPMGEKVIAAIALTIKAVNTIKKKKYFLPCYNNSVTFVRCTTSCQLF